MADNGKLQKKDIKQASVLIQSLCVVGLIVVILYSIAEKTTLSPFVYAIFGGGVLGTDNILKLIKSIFRIGNGGE